VISLDDFLSLKLTNDQDHEGREIELPDESHEGKANNDPDGNSTRIDGIVSHPDDPLSNVADIGRDAHLWKITRDP